MISLMKWCKRRGMKYIVLDVGSKDVAVLNLYRKLNFKEFGKSIGYIKKF